MKTISSRSKAGLIAFLTAAVLAVAVSLPASATPDMGLSAEELVPAFEEIQTREEAANAREVANLTGAHIQPDSYRSLGEENNTSFGVATDNEGNICLIASIADATKMMS